MSVPEGYSYKANLVKFVQKKKKDLLVLLQNKVLKSDYIRLSRASGVEHKI